MQNQRKVRNICQSFWLSFDLLQSCCIMVEECGTALRHGARAHYELAGTMETRGSSGDPNEEMHCKHQYPSKTYLFLPMTLNSTESKTCHLGFGVSFMAVLLGFCVIHCKKPPALSSDFQKFIPKLQETLAIANHLSDTPVKSTLLFYKLPGISSGNFHQCAKD